MKPEKHRAESGVGSRRAPTTDEELIALLLTKGMSLVNLKVVFRPLLKNMTE